ncbi:hypothetical protein BZG36_02121 [Bifiguratus adelaidae]|uniref:Cytochrome P450 n=1 Tax=Bifiguratus adelaidae TaxID=1938954 RepID=A0A261Y367_9FUNG|nr:hypothetical protein BZG36_02121 [Bifiguratus adelaidae]
MSQVTDSAQQVLTQVQGYLHRYLDFLDRSKVTLPLIGAVAASTVVPFAAFFGYLLYWDSYTTRFLNKIKGIPSPQGRRSLLGHVVKGQRDFTEMLYGWVQECGSVYAVQIMHMRWVVTTEPEDIKAILVTDNIQKGGTHDQLSTFFGPSNLLTMHHGPGEPYKAQRSLMNQAFKMKYIRAIHPIFLKNAKLFAQELQEWNGRSINFVFEITRVTLNIISEVIGAQHAPPEFQKSMTVLVHQLSNPLLSFPGCGYLLRHVLFQKHIKVVDKFIYKAIYDRIGQRKRGITKGSEQRDYMDILLDAEENGLKFTPAEIKDHLFIFFLAGHETTANTLSWMIYSLCTTPSAEAALLKEIDSLSEEMKFESEDMRKMVYTQHCFNETLRLYPPATATARTTQAPYTLPSHPHVVIPKHTEVMTFFYGVQRDPKYWERANDFWPERWENPPKNPYSFTPFSAGERICIGKNFFYNEAAILVREMFKKSRFELDKSYEANGVPTTKSGFVAA